MENLNEFGQITRTNTNNPNISQLVLMNEQHDPWVTLGSVVPVGEEKHMAFTVTGPITADQGKRVQLVDKTKTVHHSSDPQGATTQPGPLEQGATAQPGPHEQGATAQPGPLEQCATAHSGTHEQGVTAQSRPHEQGATAQSGPLVQDSSTQHQSVEQVATVDHKPVQ